MKKMTVKMAREVARSAIANIKRVHFWDVRTVACCLPHGWVLSVEAVTDDFYPLTVENISYAIRELSTEA